MFNKIRAASVDKDGRRLPIKQVAYKLAVRGGLTLLAIWALSLLVALNPVLFISGGCAITAVAYYKRHGAALPPELTQALAVRKVAKAAAPAVEKPAPASRASAIKRPSHADHQIGI